MLNLSNTTTHLEENGFCIPEDTICEEIRNRIGKRMNLENVMNTTIYAQSCINEFSRNFHIMNVGKDMPNEVPLDKYDGSRSQNLR
jgi:hypothetical protein